MKNSYPESNAEGCCNIHILTGEEPAGTKIDFAAFIGAGYNVETEALNLFRYDAASKAIHHSTEAGFAKALLDPPYSLCIDRTGDFASGSYAEQKTRTYRKIIKDFLSTLLDVTGIKEVRHLTVISWSDNWSNYSESGKERWGTFSWTIYDVRKNTVTLITASATD